jgi:hypothetical protein
MVDGFLMAGNVNTKGMFDKLVPKDFDDAMRPYRDMCKGAGGPFYNIKESGLFTRSLWGAFSNLTKKVMDLATFTWPSVKGLGTSGFSLPLASWQRRLRDKSKWGKPESKVDGEPYPGKGAWDKQGGLMDLVDNKKVKKGLEDYVI